VEASAGGTTVPKTPRQSDIDLIDAKTKWEPLFDMVLRFDKEVNDFVEALTPEERERLVVDADRFSSTNCGWYEYEAMHKAAAEARWRIRRESEKVAVPA
jgi:hypothetical protein